MSARFRPIGLTDGERRLILAMASMAMLGATIGLAVSVQLGGGADFLQGLAPYDLWIVASGAIGTTAALWLMRHRMGHPGLWGLAQAVLGMVGISFLAPLIGGTLVLPAYGTMFGPFTLGVILFGAPALGLLWCVTLVFVHHLMRLWVAERDSIFAARLPAE
jgi:hypothetical protein